MPPQMQNRAQVVSRCFSRSGSLDRSQIVKDLRATQFRATEFSGKFGEFCSYTPRRGYAEPIIIPVMKTSVPPSATWKMADKSGVSM
jgi:hypothetical protein